MIDSTRPRPIVTRRTNLCNSAALTQFERELIRERTMIGLSAAKARGRTGGRKHKMSPQQIRQIKALWAGRKETKVDLAKSFGVSISTIDRIVRPKSLKA